MIRVTEPALVHIGSTALGAGVVPGRDEELVIQGPVLRCLSSRLLAGEPQEVG